MTAALGLVESAWFFRRGKQYVRIVRIDRQHAGLSLVVDGPEGAHSSHHFDDSMACAVHQCELERQLVTKDFHLERVGGTRSSTTPALVIPVSHPFPSGPAAA